MRWIHRPTARSPGFSSIGQADFMLPHHESVGQSLAPAYAARSLRNPYQGAALGGGECLRLIEMTERGVPCLGIRPAAGDLTASGLAHARAADRTDAAAVDDDSREELAVAGRADRTAGADAQQGALAWRIGVAQNLALGVILTLVRRVHAVADEGAVEAEQGLGEGAEQREQLLDVAAAHRPGELARGRPEGPRLGHQEIPARLGRGIEHEVGAVDGVDGSFQAPAERDGDEVPQPRIDRLAARPERM